MRHNPLETKCGLAIFLPLQLVITVGVSISCANKTLKWISVN